MDATQNTTPAVPKSKGTLKAFTDKDAEDRNEKEIVAIKSDNGVVTEVITYATPSERRAFIKGAQFMAKLQSDGLEAAQAIL